ncbi:MAG: hypothetical protein ABIP46_14610 [Polaromonas sp.]
MNPALESLAREVALDEPAHEGLRLAFGVACAARIRHLLEDPLAVAALDLAVRYVNGQCSRADFDAAAAGVQAVANSHRGSNSIDGTAHAAVSATYAVARALAGRALQAADYAAYAAVYAYGGYAVNDPSAFTSEHAWQVDTFRALLTTARPAS